MSNQPDENRHVASPSSDRDGSARVYWRILFLVFTLLLVLSVVDKFDDWNTRQRLETLENNIDALKEEVERAEQPRPNSDVSESEYGRQHGVAEKQVTVSNSNDADLVD